MKAGDEFLSLHARADSVLQSPWHITKAFAATASFSLRVHVAKQIYFGLKVVPT